MAGVGPASTSTNPAVSGADASPAGAQLSEYPGESMENPWRNERFVWTTNHIIHLTETRQLRALCLSNGLITFDAYLELSSCYSPEHNEKLLGLLMQGSHHSFGTFREVIRHMASTQLLTDMISEWDSMGPSPELPEYIALRRSLKEELPSSCVGPASTSTNPAVSGADAPPAGAQLSEDRVVNPWRHERFVGSTANLIGKLTLTRQLRILCLSNGLIDGDALDELHDMQLTSEHNAKLIGILQQGSPDSFAKFREVIRYMDETRAFTEILRKWDSIGPSPELPEYIALR